MFTGPPAKDRDAVPIVVNALHIPGPTDLMSERQAADYLGMSSHSLAASRQGRMVGPPYLKVGAAVLYEKRELRAFHTARKARKKAG